MIYGACTSLVKGVFSIEPLRLLIFMFESCSDLLHFYASSLSAELCNLEVDPPRLAAAAVSAPPNGELSALTGDLCPELDTNEFSLHLASFFCKWLIVPSIYLILDSNKLISCEFISVIYFISSLCNDFNLSSLSFCSAISFSNFSILLIYIVLYAFCFCMLSCKDWFDWDKSVITLFWFVSLLMNWSVFSRSVFMWVGFHFWAWSYESLPLRSVSDNRLIWSSA